MRTLLLIVALLAAAASGRAQDAPQPRREFRAAWVATVNNIDWPSRPGLSTAVAQLELRQIVEHAAVLRLNAIVFQVRPAACALYDSKLEPWSEWLTGRQGLAPDPPWDPLQYLLDEAHPRGIEIHAWCNPFRARHPSAKSANAKSHVLERVPEACVKYGAYRWMDPGDHRAAEWSLAVMRDIVTRYDIDGIHIDDYFYPYPEKQRPFPDEASYRRYRAGGGRLARDDWRRRNIDTFVRRLYEETHVVKPWVKVGISPFGIARPGVPEGIRAGVDQYADLYADVLGWQRDGLCDYLAPQLYWPIDQKPQSFAVLLPWWCAQNPRQRHMWPGINPGRAAAGKAPWRRGELVQHIEMTRAQSPINPGHIHFSFKALRATSNGIAAQLLASVYTEAAPVPASPWLSAAAVALPDIAVERDEHGARITVAPSKAARFYCVQAFVDGRWQTVAVRGAATRIVALPRNAERVTVRELAANGVAGPPATRSVGR